MKPGDHILGYRVVKSGVGLTVVPEKRIRSNMPAKLGSGARFKALEGKLKRRGIRNPGGLAAKIGRAKYGKERFQELAAAGRRKAKRRKP